MLQGVNNGAALVEDRSNPATESRPLTVAAIKPKGIVRRNTARSGTACNMAATGMIKGEKWPNKRVL